MNQIAAVVVLYHTDGESFFHNLASYLPYAGRVVVVDNSPEANKQVKERLSAFDEKIFYIANERNLGIANPLNVAAAFAKAEGYTWLFTMDQDSFFEKEDMEQYLSLFSRNFINNNDTAMVGPRHAVESDRPVDSFTHVLSLITSGCLLNLLVWWEIGGFDEKLFIDEVDHEYCYRAVEAGKAIVSFNHIHLNHKLGRNAHSGYFGVLFKRKRIVHNPVRVYYMMRNYLYVRKKYSAKFPEEFRRRDKQMRVIFKNNLLFSGSFVGNLKSMIRGYLDFKRNNFNQGK
jgi:rhamnosyltransferase